MIQLKNTAFIFAIILLQTVISIFAGLMVLYGLTKNKINPNAYVQALSVGKLSNKEAKEKVLGFFGDPVKNGRVTIKFNGNQSFDLKLNEIDAVLDVNSTVDNIYHKEKKGALSKLLQGYFSFGVQVFNPVIKFNEEKLQDKLRNISVQIDREPQNADIYFQNGTITKMDDKNGIKLNMDQAVKLLKDEMGVYINKPIEFSTSNVIDTLYPSFFSEDFLGINEVVSSYSTDINSPRYLHSIDFAVNAINKVLIFPKDTLKGEPEGEFSFNKYLKLMNDHALKNENDEGYNLVASTLYAAVLSAGIEEKGITKSIHEGSPHSIDQGKAVRVQGSALDFKFKNSLQYPVMIFSEIKDSKIYVHILGKKNGH